VSGNPGTPLVAKLGVRASSRVLLDGAPDSFDLGPLPADAEVQEHPEGSPYDIGVLFCPNLARLTKRWPAMHEQVSPAGRLWVAWPKRTSRFATDVDEHRVRAHGLAHGRVDMKICAIDETWSGLAFVVRLRDR
jgi:hypothetical protein